MMAHSKQPDQDQLRALLPQMIFCELRIYLENSKINLKLYEKEEKQRRISTASELEN
jgi:hypothetical protein